MDLDTLQALGWKPREGTTHLLNSFLALAEAGDTKQGLARVRTFAAQWGPLWVCKNHPECYVSCFPKVFEWLDLEAGQGKRTYRSGGLCEWVPMEEGQEFVWEAWCVQAVLESATLLLDNQPVPERLWEPLGFICDQVPLVAQRIFVSLVLTRRLGARDGARLRVKWVEGEQSTLEVYTGLGFLHEVWLEVAQLVGKVKNFPNCKGCGRLYASTHDLQKYCSECQGGEGEPRERQLASKRDWARRKRASARRARQLAAEGGQIEAIARQMGATVQKVNKWLA